MGGNSRDLRIFFNKSVKRPSTIRDGRVIEAFKVQFPLKVLPSLRQCDLNIGKILRPRSHTHTHTHRGCGYFMRKTSNNCQPLLPSVPRRRIVLICTPSNFTKISKYALIIQIWNISKSHNNYTHFVEELLFE